MELKDSKQGRPGPSVAGWAVTIYLFIIYVHNIHKSQPLGQLEKQKGIYRRLKKKQKLKLHNLTTTIL